MLTNFQKLNDQGILTFGRNKGKRVLDKFLGMGWIVAPDDKQTAKGGITLWPKDPEQVIAVGIAIWPDGTGWAYDSNGNWLYSI